MHRICLLPVLVLPLLGQQGTAPGLRGGAVAPAEASSGGPRAFAWGRGVLLDGRPIASGNYGRGGCLADWDQDGRLDLILNELPADRPDGSTGSLVALLAPGWRRELIDTGAAFRDCLSVTLFGRHGLLVTHLQMQLRFYERSPAQTPHYRELYSIYTPSAQSGLALADIDGDGRTDILHGNYWLRSPESFELGWRLFALNMWFEEPRSAMLRIVTTQVNGKLVAVEAESEASPARFAWFEMPADPRQQWMRHDIAIPGGLHRPQVLAGTDTPGVLVVGEDNGPGSRLLRVTLPAGAGASATVVEIGRSPGYLAAGAGGTAVVVRR
ncbi:MAG: hypothetical protein J0L64_19200 [Acidobacteria bacterium]|nr:hypothetical protein [Acidobacteriota bacterium]